MNRHFLESIARSGIATEVQVALDSIVVDRTVPTPLVLKYFVGWLEPASALTDTQRNTAILAMLSHYTLGTENQQR
jgi:hypothetical protein